MLGRYAVALGVLSICCCGGGGGCKGVLLRKELALDTSPPFGVPNAIILACDVWFAAVGVGVPLPRNLCRNPLLGNDSPPTSRSDLTDPERERVDPENRFLSVETGPEDDGGATLAFVGSVCVWWCACLGTGVDSFGTDVDTLGTDPDDFGTDPGGFGAGDGKRATDAGDMTADTGDMMVEPGRDMVDGGRDMMDPARDMVDPGRDMDSPWWERDEAGRDMGEEAAMRGTGAAMGMAWERCDVMDDAYAGERRGEVRLGGGFRVVGFRLPAGEFRLGPAGDVTMPCLRIESMTSMSPRGSMPPIDFGIPRPARTVLEFN